MELPLMKLPLAESAVEMRTPAPLLNLMMLPAAPPIRLLVAPWIETP